jgi:hypothetical protein
MYPRDNLACTSTLCKQYFFNVFMSKGTKDLDDKIDIEENKRRHSHSDTVAQIVQNRCPRF